MNILPVVFSLLILLSLLTYSRQQTFVLSHLLFKQHQVEEAALQNHDNNIQSYLFTKACREQPQKPAAEEKELSEEAASGKESKKPAVKQANPKVAANRKINLYPLLNAQYAASHPMQHEEYKTLFKNLLWVVFHEERFYCEAIAQYPDIVDRLILGLSSALSEKASSKKTETIQSFRNLPLRDFALEKFRYFILQGKESKEEEGCPDLQELYFFDFVEYNANVLPIRIYLAHKEVLMAIYSDEETVDKIQTERRALHSQLVNDKLDHVTVSGEFERSFSPLRPGWLDGATLNYQVTTTAPPKKR